MKVLFVSEYFPPLSQGGGEISCLLLAKALSERGIDVSVLTTRGNAKRKERIGRVKVLRSIKGSASPRSILGNIARELLFPKRARKAILGLLEKERFDLIHYFNTTSILGKPELDIPQLMHVNSPVPFCPLGTLLYRDREEANFKYTFYRTVRSVLHAKELGKIRNHAFLKYNPLVWTYLYMSFHRRYLKMLGFDHYVAASGYMRKRLLQSGIQEKDISVSPNIVEGNTVERPKSGKRLLYLGALLRNKGILDLLDAMAQVKSKCTLDVYGQGHLRQSLNGNGRIRLKRPVQHKDIPKVLAHHDVLVIPSWIPEGFGRGVIEAWQQGTYVIASDRGALAEFKGPITHYDPEKENALASAIDSVLAGKERNVMAELKPYSSSSVAKTITSTYRKAIRSFRK